jgi:CubicO group peptidase (beta-lactamase class C family)
MVGTMRRSTPSVVLPWLLAALPAQALAGKVDELSRPLIAADVAVGFVVGVIDGETELVRSYGVLERGAAGAPDGDTLFEIGSISKVFTALLLADAVERGLCKLDDPVQQFLPDGVKLRQWEDQPVLLWHLSTHTSGLPRLPDMNGSDPQDPYARFDEARLHEVLPDVPVRWQPGTKYEYSNLAVGLLGNVLVRRHGAASYEALLREVITGPLQMRDTVVALTPELQKRLAPPHDGDGEPAHTWDLAALAGAGGIRSSVRDMLKFARLQLAPGDAPLGKAVALTQEKRHDGQNGIAVGLGWHFARDGKTRWHSGQTGGYHGYLALVPGAARAVCVLANTSRGDVDAVGERILQHLFGMVVKPPEYETPVAVDRALLQRLVGKYRMSPAAQFDVTLGARGLSAQLTGQQPLRIHARSATEFFYRAVVASITFELEGDTVKALVLHQNGRDMRCRRIDDAPK